MDHTAVPFLVEPIPQTPEYRRARGVRHPLLPPLLLVCVATLCGARPQAVTSLAPRRAARCNLALPSWPSAFPDNE